MQLGGIHDTGKRERARGSQGDLAGVDGEQRHVGHGGAADFQGAVRRGAHGSPRLNGCVARSFVEGAAENVSVGANGHIAAAVQMGRRRAQDSRALRDETAADPPVVGSDTDTSTILRPAVTLTLPPALRIPCWKLLY